MDARTWRLYNETKGQPQSASSDRQMSCPQCGATMNHHADKLDLTVVEPDTGDLGLGGVLQEVHGCPNCGNVELRKAN